MCFLFKKKIDIPESGFLQSPEDLRDMPLSAIQTNLRDLPEKYMIPYNLPVVKQVGPSCVGEAGALMKAEKERREQNHIDFDGGWLYKECKKIDGMPNVRGTYFRSALKVLKNTGAKPLNNDSLYPIGAYARVDDKSFESIKSAIYQYGVILAGFRGSNASWQGEIIKPPKKITWGHAVGLIGFEKDYIIGQNSWGENAHNKGIFKFSKNYLPYFVEAWAILCDLPSDFEVLPQEYNFEADMELHQENNDVRQLQKYLKTIGLFPAQINATGYYGGITAKAVYKFQVKYKVENLVILDRLRGQRVGPKTRLALNKLFN